jgi:outer membrane protein OmpA-like peptidoglycan-associated protein
MVVKGMGENAPAHDNSTREGRSMNRRVELRTK